MDPHLGEKSCWINRLLIRAKTMINPPPERIIWCYKRWQLLFSEMQTTIKNIICMQGLPENLNDESFIDSRYPSLIVIHDLMRDATNSKDVCELFGEGSHYRNISVACILQNGFSKGKENRTKKIKSDQSYWPGNCIPVIQRSSRLNTQRPQKDHMDICLYT